MAIIEQFLTATRRLDTRQRAQMILALGTAAAGTHEADLTAETNFLAALVILLAEIEVVAAEEFEEFVAGHDDIGGSANIANDDVE